MGNRGSFPLDKKEFESQLLGDWDKDGPGFLTIGRRCQLTASSETIG